MFPIAVKYCPVVEEEVSSSIIAVGQVGAWKVVHFDAFSSSERVFSDIREQAAYEPFQPECNSFILLEISKGTFTGLS